VPAAASASARRSANVTASSSAVVSAGGTSLTGASFTDVQLRLMVSVSWPTTPAPLAPWSLLVITSVLGPM
jgi:hypothetical protein